MSEEKIIIAEASLKVKYSDGRPLEYGIICPAEIMNWFVREMMEWQDKWSCSFKEGKQWQDALKEYLAAKEFDKNLATYAIKFKSHEQETNTGNE